MTQKCPRLHDFFMMVCTHKLVWSSITRIFSVFFRCQYLWPNQSSSNFPKTLYLRSTLLYTCYICVKEGTHRHGEARGHMCMWSLSWSCFALLWWILGGVEQVFQEARGGVWFSSYAFTCFSSVLVKTPCWGSAGATSLRRVVLTVAVISRPISVLLIKNILLVFNLSFCAPSACFSIAHIFLDFQAKDLAFSCGFQDTYLLAPPLTQYLQHHSQHPCLHSGTQHGLKSHSPGSTLWLTTSPFFK